MYREDGVRNDTMASLHEYLIIMARRRNRRPSREAWHTLRRVVWERDQQRCQGPHCRAAGPIPLEQAHIDHRIPVSRGGTHDIANLRTLCRRCHVLRADNAHRGMIAAALRDGIIPADWRALVWDDDELNEME